MERTQLISYYVVCVGGLLHMGDHVLEHAAVQDSPCFRFRLWREPVHHLFRMRFTPFCRRIYLDAGKDETVGRRIHHPFRHGIEEGEVVLPFTKPPLTWIVPLVVHGPDVAVHPDADVVVGFEHIHGLSRLSCRRRHDGCRRYGLAVYRQTRSSRYIDNGSL